ncbi:MAG: hypothetical protein II748_02130 [Clostridia bacterium]|jgi:hypothetical protein|nr:hypothetical protein [Clostridia bacterium]
MKIDFKVIDLKGKLVMKTDEVNKIPSDFLLKTYEKCGYGIFLNGQRVKADHIIEVRTRAANPVKRDTSEEF